MLTTDTLWNGALAWIGDVGCDCGRSGFGEEEVSPCSSVAFPRRGVFVRELAGRSTVADLGQAIFFNRGEPYRVRHPAASGDRCTVIVVADSILEGLASAGLLDEGAERPRFPGSAVPTRVVDDLRQRRLVDGLRARVLGGLEVEETAIRLVRTTLRRRMPAAPRREATERRHHRLVERARELIAAEFHRDLPLAAIARAVGSSPFHLSRIFRARVGAPLHRYQNRLRLRAALERLSDGEPNLTELALDLGFYDHSHFTNAFRREFSYPPSEWRRAAATADGRGGARPLQSESAPTSD